MLQHACLFICDIFKSRLKEMQENARNGLVLVDVVARANMDWWEGKHSDDMSIIFKPRTQTPQPAPGVCPHRPSSQAGASVDARFRALVKMNEPPPCGGCLTSRRAGVGLGVRGA